MLLYGEPGVGKTTLATAITKAIDAEIFYVKGSSINTEYQYSGAVNIEKIFQKLLHEKNKRQCLFIDEMDKLFCPEGSNKNQQENTAAAFWSYYDDFLKNKNSFFIATTNNLKTLPAPVKSRFTNSIIEIPLPQTDEDRLKIIEFYLQLASLSSLKSSYVKELAARTKPLDPREISEFLLAAIDRANTDTCYNKKLRILYVDLALESALQKKAIYKSEEEAAWPLDKYLTRTNQALAITTGIIAIASLVANYYGYLNQNNQATQFATKTIEAANLNIQNLGEQIKQQAEKHAAEMEHIKQISQEQIKAIRIQASNSSNSGVTLESKITMLCRIIETGASIGFGIYNMKQASSNKASNNGI